MFCCSLKPVTFVVAQNCTKGFCISSQRNFKVVVAGASGGIGQPLALLLKQNPLVSQLALYDIAPVTPGVAVDLSHMNTPAKVSGFKGPEQLADAVECADVVVISAGVPRKPGMTRDDLFDTNAAIIKNLTSCIALNAPKAIIAIITNPLNSMVPLACEVLQMAGVLEPGRVLGVTTLDLVRAATFVAEMNCDKPSSVQVPCIGGHAGATIIPVLSQARPPLQLTQDQVESLTKRIQEAGTEVVKAKGGEGSATLSMAFAAERLTNAVLRGLKGESNVVECAYVASKVTESPYFANPLVLGKNGVEKNLGYGKLNKYEERLLKTAIPVLKKNVQDGVDYANKFK